VQLPEIHYRRHYIFHIVDKRLWLTDSTSIATSLATESESTTTVLFRTTPKTTPVTTEGTCFDYSVY